MNGTTPKFLEGEALPEGYYDPPNPFYRPTHGDVNLLDLSRYATRHGKKLIELTKEEVAQFRNPQA